MVEGVPDDATPTGAGIHTPYDNLLWIPEARDYQHFALARDGATLVFDFDPEVTASAAYDYVYGGTGSDLDDKIVKMVERFNREYRTLVIVLGEHLARCRYTTVRQIQIQPWKPSLEVYGEVAEGTEVAAGEVRDRDIRHAERVSKAKKSGPSDMNWQRSAGADLRRDVKGTYTIDPNRN